MAAITFAGRVRLTPGEYVTPSFDVPAGVTLLRLVLNPNAADWLDTSLRLSVMVERSDDGGQTWGGWFGADFNGGSFTKDGSLPRIAHEPVPEMLPCKIRLRHAINLNLRVGYDGEIS